MRMNLSAQLELLLLKCIIGLFEILKKGLAEKKQSLGYVKMTTNI